LEKFPEKSSRRKDKRVPEGRILGDFIISFKIRKFYNFIQGNYDFSLCNVADYLAVRILK